jgi:hypothetical protein
MSRMQGRSFRSAATRLLATGALTAGLAVVPATANAGLLDSVSGWWPMYEGSGQVVHDLSGHGNNGTLGSTPVADANDPTWIKGFLFGSALRFDGNDFVRIPDSKALESKAVTVSAWVRGDSSPGRDRYIIGKGADDCLSSSYALYTGEGAGLSFYVTDQSGATRLTAAVDPTAIWNGKWHHVAGTFDGTTAKLFVDGKAIGGSAGTSQPINYALATTGDASLGSFLGTCDLYYTGDIDDVAIFNQALPIDKYAAALQLLFPKPLR